MWFRIWIQLIPHLVRADFPAVTGHSNSLRPLQLSGSPEQSKRRVKGKGLAHRTSLGSGVGSSPPQGAFGDLRKYFYYSDWEHLLAGTRDDR